ncbi:MAG: glycosyl hydrolase family 28-related protein [Brevundimonas sp.]
MRIAGTLALGLLAATPTAAQTPRSMAGLPLAVVEGYGATVPFAEHEAEAATFTGRLIGPDRAFGTLAAEASGRRAVLLDEIDQSVTFVVDAPADAITVRYAVPDAKTCRDGDARIGVHAEGRRIADLPLTPCFSWYYGAYPFSHDGGEDGHHAFDHVRLRFDRRLAAGATVSLRFARATRADWVVVDLANFETVPAAPPPPEGALSVLDLGADPTGMRDSRHAIQTALDQGRREQRPVWLPEGVYRVDGHLIVDRVRLIGAGPWRSVLTGDGVGVYGLPAPEGSSEVVLRDFAIIGQVMDRDDHAQLNGVGGALNRSRIEGLFIQHTKAGVWLDGPMDDVTVRGLRILDQAADGLNFHGGATRVVVEDTFVRNTGDDGLAAWSHPTPNSGLVYRRNTVIAPVLANGIAIYGGRDIEVTGNLVADTLTRGGGLHLGARFDATPVEGTVRFDGNLLARTGSLDPVWGFGVGAIWLYALDRPIDADIRITNTLVMDSTDAALMTLGKAIRGLGVEDISVSGGTGLLTVRSPGQARMSGVTAETPGVEIHDPGFVLDPSPAP